MTVVVGLFGFFLIPDYPNRRNPLAFWFTKADAALAMERLERHNRAEPKRMDLKAIKCVDLTLDGDALSLENGALSLNRGALARVGLLLV